MNQKLTVLLIFLTLAGLPIAASAGDNGVRLSYNTDPPSGLIYADGEMESITVTAENPSKQYKVTETIKVEITKPDGSTETLSKQVEVAAGNMKKVTFEHSFEKEGKYEVKVYVPNTDTAQSGDYIYQSPSYVVETITSTSTSTDSSQNGLIAENLQYQNSEYVSYVKSFKDAQDGLENYEKTGIPPLKYKDGELTDTSLGDLDDFATMRSAISSKTQVISKQNIAHAKITPKEDKGYKIGFTFKQIATGQRQSLVFTHHNKEPVTVEIVNQNGQEIDSSTTYKISKTGTNYETSVIDLSPKEVQYVNNEHQVYVVVEGADNMDSWRLYCGAMVTNSLVPASACEPAQSLGNGIYASYKVSDTSIFEGELTKVKATVFNTNLNEKKTTVNFRKDGNIVNSKRFTIEGKSKIQYTFYTSFEKSGTHTVTINKLPRTEILVSQAKGDIEFDTTYSIPQYYYAIDNNVVADARVEMDASNGYNGRPVKRVVRFDVKDPDDSKFHNYGSSDYREIVTFTSSGVKSATPHYDPNSDYGAGKGTYQGRINDLSSEEFQVVSIFEPWVQDVDVDNDKSSEQFTFDVTVQDDSPVTDTSEVRLEVTTSDGETYVKERSVTFQYNAYPTFTVNYDKCNTYDYTVTVTDEDGKVTDTYSQNNLDCNNGPSVDVSASDTYITGGETITFTADASDGDGSISDYDWSIGGSGSSESEYINSDTTVTVTVTDDDGATASDDVYVEYNDPDPVYTGGGGSTTNGGSTTTTTTSIRCKGNMLGACGGSGTTAQSGERCAGAQLNACNSGGGVDSTGTICQYNCGTSSGGSSSGICVGTVAGCGTTPSNGGWDETSSSTSSGGGGSSGGWW